MDLKKALAGVGVLKRARNGRKGRVQRRADQSNGNDDHDCDQGGNQAVLDSGHTFVFHVKCPQAGRRVTNQTEYIQHHWVPPCSF